MDATPQRAHNPTSKDSVSSVCVNRIPAGYCVYRMDERLIIIDNTKS